MACDLYPAFPQQPITVVLCGVGGQGTITAADLLARAAMNAGFDVKVSEIHGMAQRGGSVSTTVRFGSSVNSMVCDPGSADIVISFELVEALRCMTLLKPSGHIIVNDVAIKSMPVLSGIASMPEDPKATLASLGEGVASVVDAESIARQAGNPKCANVALLASASHWLPIDDASWRRAIESRVPPKTLEANLAAFSLAHDLVNRP